MKKFPRCLPAAELIKALCKLGFEQKRQKGSHVILIKETGEGKVGCTVPLHKELKIGTVKGILKQAKISEEEFARHI
jgi:predicted RNA binding protein YcfA (HicA-like mRNA interferase family)